MIDKKEWMCNLCPLAPCFEYSIEKPIICTKGKKKNPKFIIMDSTN